MTTRAEGDAPRATVQLVRDRDGGCARCGTDVGLSTQHRKARRMGGSRGPEVNRPDNLLTLCGHGTAGCHGWVEHHPVLATEAGWSVPSWQDPAGVPVLYTDGWWVLDEHGGRQRYDLPSGERPGADGARPGRHGGGFGGGGGAAEHDPYVGQPWPPDAGGDGWWPGDWPGDVRPG